MSINKITKVALLSVISFGVMLLEFIVPLFPAFLMFDFSDVFALLGSFALGPVAGVLIVLVKNILHLILKWNMGSPVGELANFIVGGTLVFIAGYIYKNKKNIKSAIKGMLLGSLGMGVVGGLMNYFVLIPFYSNFFPIEAVIEMGTTANSAIVNMSSLVFYGIVPFNIIKGIAVSLITLLLYKRVSRLLHDPKDLKLTK